MSAEWNISDEKCTEPMINTLNESLEFKNYLRMNKGKPRTIKQFRFNMNSHHDF